MSTVLRTSIEEAAPAASSQTENRGRILVVDDMFDNRTVLRRRLVSRQFEVVEAEDGPTALALIESQPFDLVLLDVMMPGMSGLEVLTRIRQDFASERLPVIMVTAKSFSEDVVTALEKGADDYVTKPVDFAVALARISMQLARKRASDLACAEADRQAAELEEARDRAATETEQKLKSEAAVDYLATHDPLTGLANRVVFDKELAEAAESPNEGAPGASVLFIDLDRFKAINDTLGHLVGDELLKQVANRIGSLISTDDCLARFGGDEFVVLHRHVGGSDTSVALGNRIVNAIQEPFFVDGRELALGSSVGIASCATASEIRSSMLSDADIAMYAAKRAGGNAIRVFDLELAEGARARRELEMELQHALKRGELQLHYQPILDVKTGKVTVYEALLRWHHSELGTISPGRFIPVAEETGLILPIGEWVLRQACAACTAWPGDVKVAVNLSSVQIERGNVVAVVMNALAESGLSPERLELEITESMLAESEKNLQVLRQLREIGVHIALDDFGTGYSSLSFLRGFDFNKIKVDQSFVRSIDMDEGSQKIITSVAKLAGELGIVTTAEGVETSRQFEFVKEAGLDQIQGFLIGAPAKLRADNLPAHMGTIVHANSGEPQ